MNQTKRIMSLFVAVFGLMSLSITAHAFTEGACKDDEKKLCGDVKPGGGAIKACMKQHEADLSQACKDNIAEGKQKMQERMKEVKDACKDDLKQYCANVTPGEGREIACLHSYNDKLSAACKEKLPKRGMHKGMGHEGTSATPPPPPPAK